MNIKTQKTHENEISKRAINRFIKSSAMTVLIVMLSLWIGTILNKDLYLSVMIGGIFTMFMCTFVILEKLEKNNINDREK